MHFSQVWLVCYRFIPSLTINIAPVTFIDDSVHSIWIKYLLRTHKSSNGCVYLTEEKLKDFDLDSYFHFS